MEISDKLKEFMGIATEKVVAYGEQVKERVTNPLQTLATALEEGMPTEENPTGMFGAGGITKIHGLPEVFKSQGSKAPDWKFEEPRSSIPEGFKPSKDMAKVRLDDKTTMYKLDDGRFINEGGDIILDDLQALIDHIKNPSPKVIRSNRK